ncbi:hypothetical protein TNIN_263231 [Trichonephila inaurata madagascariensis]|uniref:Uncharacterized protein n=1 Tax=Trichonephila inaurata madagascariensis TaxID=2747483 RepID=A0A8X6IVL6_9ARAC|nr:hypothetical protein TNIN_263231 [Trichonephila inaurata madagascariensis]
MISFRRASALSFFQSISDQWSPLSDKLIQVSDCVPLSFGDVKPKSIRASELSERFGFILTQSWTLEIEWNFVFNPFGMRWNGFQKETLQSNVNGGAFSNDFSSTRAY